MKTTKLYPLFGIGVALITFNTSAIASEDDKLYPGALCQPSSNTDAISRTFSGAMFNASTVTQFWTCPIVRDVNAAGSIEFARVTVIDRNANGVLSCTLHSSTSTGTGVDSDSENTNGAPGTVSLVFGSGDVNAVDTVASGYAYFRCTIPGTVNGQRSGVVTYIVSENDGED